MIILAFSFLCSACETTSSGILTLENYSKYIEITSGTNGGMGGGSFWLPSCYVRIKKGSNTSSLQNFNITYKFKIYDAAHTVEEEKEFTESLGSLSSDYHNSFELRLDYTYNTHPPELFTTVEVVEISGTAQGGIAVDKNISLILPFVFLLIVFLILGFFVAHGLKFLANFNKIQTGMSYNEVIDILGEPSSNSKIDNISTCVWKIYVLRGWIIVRAVTFQDDAVISKTE